MLYKITLPLALNDKGTAIRNLKAALKQLLTQMQDFGQSKDSALLTDFEKDIASATFTQATAKMVTAFQVMVKLPQTGKVDEATAKAINEILNLTKELPELPVFILTGTVTASDGIAVANKKVAAYDKDLRKEGLLGSSLTAKDGSYKITYTAEKFSRAEKQTADVFIRVTDLNLGNIFNTGKGNPDNIYHTSAVLYNAPQNAVIDAVLDEKSYRSSPEFTRYLSLIKPLVEGQDVEIKDLNEGDIDFLTNETAINTWHLSLLSKAHIYGAGDMQFTELYYGLLRQGLPVGIYELLSLKHQELKGALVKSVEQNIISNVIGNKADELLDALLKKALMLLTDIKNKNYTGVGAVITAAQISQELKQRFLELYLRYSTDEFEKRMAADAALCQPTVQNEIKFVFAAKEITGGDIPLLSALSHAHAQKQFEHIAALEKGDWISLIKAGSVPDSIAGANEKEKIENYAAELVARAEKKYPSIAFLAKIKKDIPDKINKLNGVFDLLHNEPDIIKQKAPGIPTNIKVPKKSLGDIDAAKEAINTYKALGLKKIVLDKTLTAAKKQQIITQKINAFNLFMDNNANMDLLTFNAGKKASFDKFNWKGVANEEKPGIKKQIHALRRVLHLGDGNANTSRTLLNKGLDSGGALLSVTPHVLATITGLSSAQLKPIITIAENMAGGAANNFITLAGLGRDSVLNTGGFSNWSANNYAQDILDTDTYSDLFGSQDYCDCDECKSILSPAAYFVDLMRFIGKHITEPVYSLRMGDPLNLKVRRPDLWTLPLTCQNTNERIPYLQIVVEVLEAYLQKITEESDIYIALPGKRIGFNLGFNLYNWQMRHYLGHFNLRLYDVFKLLLYQQPESVETWRERLDLSSEELLAITTPTDDENDLKARLGNPGNFLQYPVQNLLAYAGISRSQLDELLAGKELITTPLNTVRVDKIQSTDPLTDPLVNYVEVVTGLDKNAVDFIHRFIRLWRKTTWSITEFYTILSSLKQANLLTGDDILNTTAVVLCGKLVELQSRLHLSAQQLPVIYSAISTNATGPNSLFLRLFDKNVIDAQISSNGTMAATTRGYLISGLGISEAELVSLLTILRKPVFNETTPGPSLLTSSLTVANISLLYRYCLITKALNVSITDTQTALMLLYGDAESKNGFNSLEKIFGFIAFCDKLFQYNYTVGQVAFITSGIESNTVSYKLTNESVSELADKIQRERYFTSATLAAESGITEPEAQSILQQMTTGGSGQLAIFNAGSARYRLTANYNPSANIADVFTAINASETLTAKITGVRSFFDGFIPETILFKQLAIAFNINSAALAAIKPLASETAADVFNAVVATDTSALEQLIQKYQRLIYLLGVLKLNEEQITFAGKNSRLFLSTPDFNLETVWALSEYALLINKSKEQEVDVETLMLNFPDSFQFTDEQLRILSGVYKCEPVLLKSFADSALRPTDLQTVFEKINYLQQCVAMCSTIGINGSSLWELIKTNATDCRATCQLLIGAFNSRYPDITVREEMLKPYNDRVNTIKRDILCGYLIGLSANNTNTQQRFKDRNDLYSYFLLDVNMSSCFETSRIVAATGSLQLYVHRNLLNMEYTQGLSVVPDDTPNDHDDDQVVVSESSSVSYEEWQWRKNYRVWEANRRVFLCPENYILPELLDKKTHLFKELEDELLQQRITATTAEAAYQKYISQFSAIAKLVIAGSYYHTESNTYYFFGRTHTDPYQYYYRQWIDQTEWTDWQKIELGISSPSVTAIIYMGRLFVFWMEIISKESTRPSTNGESAETEVTTEFKLVYSYLNENNVWLMPQKVKGFDNSITTAPLSTLPVKYFPRLTANNSEIQLDCSYNGTYILGSSVFAGLETHSSRLNLYNNKLIAVNFPTYQVMAGSLVLGYNSSEQTSVCYLNRNYNDSLLDSLNYYSNSEGLTNLIAQEKEPKIEVVGQSKGQVIFSISGQQYLIRKNETNAWQMQRLSTSLADKLGERLFTRGLNDFLSLETQQLTEARPDITIINESALLLPVTPAGIDFNGAYGQYYTELFFHIPFLIASHLNASQKFKEADDWFRKIFDPMAVPAGENPSKDRNWRFIKFRGLTPQRLEDILSDPEALATYRNDPFNPHAIARVRISAYQKTIVMKYIDNLLDWGDYLFAQDTMESLNEATMLYVLAQDILGKRPVKLGKCETRDETTITYGALEPSLDEADEFLVEMETVETVAIKPRPLRIGRGLGAGREGIDGGIGFSGAGGTGLGFTIQLVQQTMVFCIPNNEDLLAYWDRVEEQLNKIRNCMNISGVRRQLALFQPRLDPMMLVKAKATGLSLEDILFSLNKPVSKYRFVYLLEKARQYTQTVQSLGAALLSALEKKDIEELTLIRSINEKEILGMTRQLKKNAISEAGNQKAAIDFQAENTQQRVDYYNDLLDGGLTKWETTQQVTKHLSTAFQSVAGYMHFSEGIYALMPQVGSPFAMTYGGDELSDSANGFAGWLGSMSAFAESISASAALEAGFERRKQEWRQQLNTARKELEQVQKQQLAAGFRVQIAEQDLELLNKNIEHNEEVETFYKDKFTKLGLYNYLATKLSRLYREAYAMAYDMAIAAEEAYRFERGETDFFITADNWQTGQGGLLAGENLLMQLARMEKQFLENNTREFELTKHISIAQLNPLSLLLLKQTGSCNIELPEVLFNMDYAGHYFRRIKSVSISIPCIAGPYASVSCTLKLIQNSVRTNNSFTNPAFETNQVPFASIATSSAQNDSGVFELNFRDERYLPFEGAGVYSTWSIDLPDPTLAQFDYNTISDVIMHVKYTARDGGNALRDANTNALAEQIAAATSGDLTRLLSLKNEFPDSFHQLKNDNGETTIKVEKNHFQFFLQRKSLNISNVKVWLRTDEPINATVPSLTVKQNEFELSTEIAIKGVIKFVLKPGSALTGSPINTWPIKITGFDKDKLKDVFLEFNYTTQSQ